MAKSTYKSGPTPKSATVVIEAAGKGIKVSIDAVTADGPLKWGYTSARDGKDSPVTGHPYYQAAAATQTSPTEGTIVYKAGGKAVVTVKTAVSKDGKTLTAHHHGHGRQGSGAEQRGRLHQTVETIGADAAGTLNRDSHG